MAETTAISWTDATWSPWEGCTKVSPGCTNCYASAMNTWLQKGANWGPGAPRREYGEDHWKKPVRWNAKAEKAGTRLRVFPSVCDPFDNEVGKGRRQDFFRLIRSTPWLTWLLLTKRIGNAERMIEEAICDMEIADDPTYTPWPWPNVWLGATVVNQEEADRDIPKLLATPARVRFLSIEPQLEPIDLTMIRGVPHNAPFSVLSDRPNGYRRCVQHAPGHCLGDCAGRLPAVDWVIVGGESGRGARDFDIGWARSLVAQCTAAGVPVFVKQMGAKPVWSDDDEDSEPPHWGRIRFIHKSGAEPQEWPIDLRVQQFPEVRHA